MSGPPGPRHDEQPGRTAPAANGQPGRRWWLAAAAVGLTASATGFWWHLHRSGTGSTAAKPQGAGGTAPTGPSQLGDDFWALNLPQPQGTDLALISLRGRPLLVNFWATWCPPCVREMPLLDQFYRQYHKDGLQMLGIAVDGAKPVLGFLERNPVGFAIGLAGADGSGLARSLGNTAGGLPYTVLADAGGAIVRRQMGELKRSQLEEWAQALGMKL